MKFDFRPILLLYLLFLSSKKESESFDDNEQNDNYEDYNKFKEKIEENLKKEKETIEILDLLKAANDKFKKINTSEKAKEKFEKNAKVLFAYIMLKNVLPVTISNIICYNVGCIDELEKAIEYITKNIFVLTDEIFKKNNFGTSSFNEKIDDYIFKKIIKKYPKAATLVLSFTNLAWSCYELYYTFQETSKIGLYEEKLKELKNRADNLDSNNYFELKLEDDYDTINEKINNKKKEIEKIQKDFEDLIIDIESSIVTLKYQQEKSIIGFSIGGGTMIFGLFGAMLTGGAGAVPLLISALGGLTSAGVSLVDLEVAENGIKKLKVILKEANEAKKKLEKKIDELIEKAKAMIFNKRKYI